MFFVCLFLLLTELYILHIKVIEGLKRDDFDLMMNKYCEITEMLIKNAFFWGILYSLSLTEASSVRQYSELINITYM